MNAMEAAPIGVTGASGRLGGRITHKLAAAGVSQRLVVRHPARAPKVTGATVAQAAFEERDAAVRALSGVQTLLMVSAPESPDRVQQHRTFIDAATEAGVQHVVYTSFVGAAPDAVFTLSRQHHDTEEYLRASGMAFTFLRDNLYGDYLPNLVSEDGVIRGPAGQGRIAAVAADDIADAAVAVLLDPAAHAGTSYDLTGPQALTLDEVAETMTRATGRQISYQEETVEQTYASRAHYGVAQWQLEAWVSTYTAIAAGQLAAVSGDVEQLTGHAPISFATLMRRGSLGY